MSKKYDLCIVTGQYTDKNGNQKKQYKTIGVVMQGDSGYYMMIDRTFNPAGVPNPDNRSNCIVSMFEPRDKVQHIQSVQAPQQAPDTDIPF